MTSSRVVRGTKGRIVLCICAIVVITGIIACYNNTLSQLEDVRKASEQCHQQQENLSTQLQVIYDYKQRLEKSLKTEKAEHQITKKDLESKLEEERTKHGKATNEANLKFSSLQQHYNLLQTEHEDLKEENSKIQQEHMHEINDLQAKLKEVQGQLKQSINEKESAFEHLKTQYLQLQIENENLERQIRGTQSTQHLSESDFNHLEKVNHELQRELDQLKAKCSIKPHDDVLSAPKLEDVPKHNFSKQIKIADSVYQIQDARNNPKQDNNVADLPSNAGSAMQPIQSPALNQLDSPNENQNPPEQNENVLVAPRGQKSSSTTSKTVSKASLDVVQPLNIPTVTPSNNKSRASPGSRIVSSNHVLAAPFGYKKIPAGVVPAPDAPLEPADESKNKKDEKERDIREDVNNAFPNRYRNNLILNEMANEDKAIEADRQEQKNEKVKPNVFRSDVGDKENNAVEVFDPPVEKEKDPFALDDLHDKVGKKHDIKLDGPAHKVYDAQDGGDYDKEVQNDMQLEENDPEADDGPMKAGRIPQDVIRR